jgi:hypothetical protein
VPPTDVKLTVQALGAGINTNAAGVTLAGSTAGSGEEMSFKNQFAGFTGGVSSYALGASRRVQATIHAHEQQVYEIDVPAGSASLMARASKPADASADLDVYVYDCSGKECRPAANAADPLIDGTASDETVIVQNPAAGKWKVVVDGAAVPAGGTTYGYLDVVFNQSFGTVAATDQPSKHDEGAEWNVKTNVWAAALPTGRAAFPAFPLVVKPTQTEQFTIGLVEMPVSTHVADGSPHE